MIIIIIFPFALLSGCKKNSAQTKIFSNGYYSAEAKDFDSDGWKEFISIYVHNGRIITVEYNAKNASGFIKSWDLDYMRNMYINNRTYPSKYVREYTSALLVFQDPGHIDAVVGATRSYYLFTHLAEAVVEQARMGNRQIKIVELSPYKESSNP